MNLLFKVFWNYDFISGVLTILRYPYPRDVQEPAVYDTIRVHTEGEIVPEKTENPTFAVSYMYMYMYTNTNT